MENFDETKEFMEMCSLMSGCYWSEPEDENEY